MVFNVTPTRALRWVVMCLHLFAGSLIAAAQPSPPRAAATRIAAAGEPLRFFTIQDRLEALRTAGKIQTQGAMAPSKTVQHDIPAPHSLGLRLSVAVIEPETLLGAVPFAVPGGDLASKWRGAMVRWTKDEIAIRGCENGGCKHPGARTWLRIRQEARLRHGLDTLSFVHASLNRAIRYASDLEAFGITDYWASPLEVVEKAGDCEDYAIAKYLMLRSIGLDAADMKLVALREAGSYEYHAILGVRSEGEWLFLDNRRATLTREADYADALPIAVVDEGGQSMLIKIETSKPDLRLSTL
ncbi:MAG: hypothetical protein CFE31_09810 [Rhizobiales bacterium PAR1]|nr:MAG: hypothetical protein CFE31_09810 [Rhizobiales bacterium PAR1]